MQLDIGWWDVIAWLPGFKLRFRQLGHGEQHV